MTPTVPTSEPKGYAVTAAELRRIAAALDTLPPGDKVPYVQMSVVTAGTEDTIAAVDAVGFAILGERGETGLDPDGRWRHRVRGHFIRRFLVSVSSDVPQPPDPKDAEIERLRAEVAAERAAKEFAQSHLGTEGAVSQPKPDTLLTEYTGRGEIGIVEGDTAAEQYDNAAARYDADEVVTGRASVPDPYCGGE